MQQTYPTFLHSETVHFSDDQILLSQIRGGDQTAFEDLYRKHWRFAYDIASRRLNNGYDAKDIVQEVFTQLWLQQQKETATIITDIKAYLYVAVRNNVFKWMEKENVFVELPQLLSQLQHATEDADSELILHELETAYRLMLEKMPQQQKRIFEMKFEHELSSDQIASLLKLSPKTVRNQLGRALSRVRTMLISAFASIILLF